MKTPIQQAIDKLIDLAYQMGTDDEVLDSFSAGEKRGYLDSASELHKFLELEKYTIIMANREGVDMCVDNKPYIIMELSGYTMSELIELRNNISNYILNKEDGFLYINRIHSYGRSHDVISSNLQSAMELCDRYTGDDGIAELYTNNPEATGYVYGGIYLINSKEEYDKWVEYKTLKSLIREAEDTIKKWENRGNVSFYSRPRFEPSITNEELNDYIEQLNKLGKEVVEPKLIDGSDDLL